MYTRRMSAGGLAVPEHYSGNAFRYPPPGEGEVAVREEREAPAEPEEEAITPIALPEKGTHLSLPNLLGSGGGLGLGGIGGEELLLLGLCLLLLGERTEEGSGHGLFRLWQGNETVLCLMLLLLLG